MKIGSSQDTQAKFGIYRVGLGRRKLEKVERKGGLWRAWQSGMVEMEEGCM